ncbi:MAG: tRNA (guanine(46)-N(7))-methyltransferase TrmB, partial [Pseudomonadota bacterium]
LSAPAPQPLTSLFGTPVTKLRLEVGFGGGEHLIDHAAREPVVGLIGAEPYETGMMQAARAATGQGLKNVRLHMGDARPLIDWLPTSSVDRIDVLYPDPWPKQRHWKRRFISIANLTAMHRVLAPSATVRFASDIPAYCDWTRSHVRAHAGFQIVSDTLEAWPHWPSTRYEAKALREGRTPQYLTLQAVNNATDQPTL